MLTHFRHLQLFRRVNRITINNLYCFAKEVKKDAGKKDDKAAAAAPLVEEPKMEQLILKWIQPSHSPLSPSQTQYLNERFDDLSESDKEILDRFAQKILELPTAVLMDVIKKGGLGTTDMYYTAVDPLPQGDLSTVIKQLRKQI